MSVESWNTRLKEHFEELHQQRVLSKINWPIFGLEHGLSFQEVSALQADIREYISKLTLSINHALPWVVYATEIGYRYEGYEYWQTFEEQTPGWEYHGDRYWLRNCFTSFYTRYGGAKPSGIWADHFSIICWPITHAILPIDLQRHLAKILYDLRYQFSTEMLDDPNILGEMVRQRAWTANSRFQDFTQNPLLIGQIAAALLLQGQEGFESLILPKTLERIKQDLDEVRYVRGWLRDASRYAQKVHLEGLSRGSKGLTYHLATTVAHARQQLEEIAIEPRIILQPTDVGSWRVLLEIPDLSQMLVRFPQLRPALTESRCRVAGASGRLYARGWTLYGPQLIALEEWPELNEVLLKFERSTPQLDFLLSTECLLRPGQIFLFKIASDDLAYQIRSLSLRLENKYIVVNTSGPFQQSRWLAPAALECKRTHAAVLEMPDVLDSELEQFIKKLNLQVARSIEVWPAGLTAAKWDGEGYAEWVSTECPCIGFRVDHEVKNVSIVLDDDQRNGLQFVPDTIGEPIFIGLPHLRIGTHRVAVSVQYTSTDLEEETGFLEIAIRDPQVWRPGTGIRSALIVIVEPRDPTLEQLWGNRVDLQVLGPELRKITCRIELFDTSTTEPVLSHVLPELELPVDTSTWRLYFDQNVRKMQTISNVYDSAYSCKIIFDAGELGSFTFKCERELRPLRWLVRYDSLGHAIKFIDDTGALSSPSLCKYDFNKPDKALPQDADAFRKDFVIAANGLYFAQSKEYGCGIILPPRDEGFDFHAQLNIHPEISQRVRSPSGIIEILRFIGLWSGSRLTGNIFCETIQRQIIEALTQYLFLLIGGKKWGAVEDSIRNSTTTPSIESMVLGLSYKAEYEKLRRQFSAMSASFYKMSTEDRIARLTFVCKPFIRIISQQSKEQPTPGVPWLAELALRLASYPEGVLKWAGKYQRWGLDNLLQQPILVRCARFIALIVEQQKAIYRTESSFFDWEWESH